MISLFPPIDRVPAFSTKQPDTVFLKSAPVSLALSDHEGVPELAPDSVQGKIPLNATPSDGTIFFLLSFVLVPKP